MAYIESIKNSCNSGKIQIESEANVEKIGGLCFANATNLEKIKINKPANSIEGSPWGAIRGTRIIEWQN